MSRQESLLAYTLSGARQLGLEKETGSITPGKSADFVVLDRDIMCCTAEELKEIQVKKTCFRGRPVYGG